jgi:hypothetical protein
MSDQFVFVPCEPTRKDDPQHKFQIRSHSKKGKNARSDSRRALQRARTAAQEAVLLAESVIRDQQFMIGDDGEAPDNRDCENALQQQHRRLFDVYRSHWTGRVPPAMPPIVHLDAVSTRYAQSIRKSPRELLQIRE